MKKLADELYFMMHNHYKKGGGSPDLIHFGASIGMSVFYMFSIVSLIQANLLYFTIDKVNFTNLQSIAISVSVFFFFFFYYKQNGEKVIKQFIERPNRINKRNSVLLIFLIIIAFIIFSYMSVLIRERN